MRLCVSDLLGTRVSSNDGTEDFGESDGGLAVAGTAVPCNSVAGESDASVLNKDLG
jgi:hypothetical protein